MRPLESQIYSVGARPQLTRRTTRTTKPSATDTSSIDGAAQHSVDAPRYIRSTVYHYTFTSFALRSSANTWWKREFFGEYCPTLELVEGKLSKTNF